MGRALHKGRQGLQVPRSTWWWPGLRGLCDDSAQGQSRWRGAQAGRVPVWGKHLLRRAPPGPQLQRTATLVYTLRERSRFCSFPLGTWGSVWHGLPLSNSFETFATTQRSPQPNHPPLTVPITLATSPGLCRGVAFLPKDENKD